MNEHGGRPLTTYLIPKFCRWYGANESSKMVEGVTQPSSCSMRALRRTGNGIAQLAQS
jgi:hypothetical protein